MSDAGKHIELGQYQNSEFSRGRGKFVELMWLICSAVFVESFVPGNFHRLMFLRLFGAKIGRGTVIKPAVKVKFPWRLTIGVDSWIGEGVWIDNLDHVSISDNCCLSQDVYLCTGSHDWSDVTFSLRTAPIVLKHGVWLGAKSVVCPGVVVETGVVLTVSSVLSVKTDAWTIYQGNPAVALKRRELL